MESADGGDISVDDSSQSVSQENHCVVGNVFCTNTGGDDVRSFAFGNGAESNLDINNQQFVQENEVALMLVLWVLVMRCSNVGSNNNFGFLSEGQVNIDSNTQIAEQTNVCEGAARFLQLIVLIIS